jgi:hypothetical protein
MHINARLDAIFGRLGNDGAAMVGHRSPAKHGEELPPLAKKFRKLLKERKWTAKRLADEAAKMFGDEAAIPTSFRRLISRAAPTSDTKTVRQAEAIIEANPVDRIEQRDGASLTIDAIAEKRRESSVKTISTVAAIAPHLSAARDASEEEIVAESRKLMHSRHASLHALLTLLLAEGR